MTLVFKANRGRGEAAELKATKDYLRIDEFYDDSLVSSLITAARLMIENYTNRILINQEWSFSPSREQRDRSGYYVLPLLPAHQIVGVQVNNAQATYTSKQIGERLSVKIENEKEGDDIEISFIAGYGDRSADVPESLKHALYHLAGFWYENRGVSSTVSKAIPDYILAMLEPYKVVRL